ncbi:MAG: hypothetical protein AMXMBFR45_24350 [Gammaproteobacteria bacterium]
MTIRILIIAIFLPLALTACGDSQPAAEQPEAEAHQTEGASAGHEHEEEALALSAEQIQAAAIELAQAGPARIRASLPLYGVIAPNAERVREVAARYPGAIRSVARKIGDPVSQGETLATVESNESLQTYPVVAPLAGVVTARNANPGEQTGDKALFTVADLSTVWVELSLFPRDVGKVRVGQSVRVKSADAGPSSEGKVVYVAPFGSATSQTLTARVLLDNIGRRWAPGLYVTAEVTLSETEVPLAVRNEALQTLEGKSVVFVHGEKGFEPRTLRLGRDDGEHSEVLEGLAVGESYVTRNSFILKAELGKGEAAHED